MFAIHEIEIENQRSVFPRLFCCLAQSVYSACGRGGEGAVREAVRNYAAARGAKLKAAHCAAGLKQNLRSYCCAPDSPADSRKREAVLSLCEEVYIKEVYTCPYASIWEQRRCSHIGKWFCEEFEKARLEAYTGGYGQMHLSEALTEKRNNHCRLAMYYRKANISREQALEAFSEDRLAPVTDLGGDDRFHMGEGRLCLLFYYSLYEVALRRFGEEGRCALSNGLREFALDAVNVMRDQARRTLRPCDRRFAECAFPLPLDISDPLYGSGEGLPGADALLEKALLARIRKALAQNS